MAFNSPLFTRHAQKHGNKGEKAKKIRRMCVLFLNNGDVRKLIFPKSYPKQSRFVHIYKVQYLNKQSK